MSDDEQGVDGLPSPAELRRRQQAEVDKQRATHLQLPQPAAPLPAAAQDTPASSLDTSADAMGTPRRKHSRSILKREPSSTPGSGPTQNPSMTRRSVSFAMHPSPGRDEGAAVLSPGSSGFPDGGNFSGFSFTLPDAGVAEAVNEAGGDQDRVVQPPAALMTPPTASSDAAEPATGMGEPNAMDPEQVSARLSMSNLHRLDESQRRETRDAGPETAVTTETSETQTRQASETATATTDGPVRMQSAEDAAAAQKRREEDGGGDDDEPEDSLSRRERRRKKKGKVHPLLLMPKTAWRVRVRAFFFPQLHRTVLAIQNVPVPLEEPRFGDWFENLMVSMIFINIIILALFDPFDSADSTRSRVVFTFQVVITFVFQFELLIRAIATGSRRMLNPLRFLDAVVIALCTGAIIAELAGSSNRLFGISVLRSPRLLRPLRNLGALPAVMVLVDSLSMCAVKIVDVSTLFISFVIIFAVASVGMYKGVLQNRCVNEAYFNLTAVNDTLNAIDLNYTWSGTPENFVCGGLYDELSNATTQLACSPDQLCDLGDRSTFGMSGWRCPMGYRCHVVGNPVAGFVGFDNIAMSFLTLFVSSSQQMWFQVAGDAADSTDSIAFVYLAFFVMVSILLFNLMIVIITVDFDLARQRAQQAYEEGGGQQSKFQDLVSHLIAQKRAAEEAMANVTTTQSDNIAIAAAQRTFEETTKAVGRIKQLTNNYVVSRAWFQNLIMVLVVINSIVLAMVHYDMNETLAEVIDWSNLVLLCLFSAESVLRLTALSFKDFIAERMNIFDLAVNIVGWVDVLTTGTDLGLLRAFRIIRALKLLRLFPEVYHWIGFILASIKSSPVILVLIFFVTLVFALMCMQLLGGNMCGLEPDSGDNYDCFGRPRYNFDDFGHALITSFQVITGDNWNDVMYVAMVAQGAGMSVLFFLYFYGGNFILLSLFVGILLSARSDEADAIPKSKASSKTPGVPSRASGGGGGGGGVPPKDGDGAAAAGGGSKQQTPSASRQGSRQGSRAGSRAASPRPPSAAGAGAGMPTGETAAQPMTEEEKKAEEEHARAVMERLVPIVVPVKKKDDDIDKHLENTAMAMLERRRKDPVGGSSSAGAKKGGFLGLVSMAMNARVEVEQLDEDDDQEEVKLDDNGNPILSKESQKKLDDDEREAHRSGTTVGQLVQRQKQRMAGADGFVAMNYEPPCYVKAWRQFRRVCHIVAEHLVFHIVTVIVVLASSAAMAVRNPIAAPDTTAVIVVDIIDTVAKAYYITECFLKFVAYGIRGKAGYFRRDNWNSFDLFLTFLGLILLILKQTRARISVWFHIFNSLMALRPLSLVRYSTSMNVVARALGQAVIQMRYAFGAIFLVIFMYAVVGVQLFNGRLRACNIDGEIVPEIQANCTNVTGTWVNNTPNFDNVFSSLFSLFVVLTLELWTVIMYRAMDYDGPGLPPKTDANAWAALYFIIFAVIGGFIMVNIFMSVLVDCYNRSKRNVTAQRSLKLTREQNGWIGTNRRLLRALPKEAHESLLVMSPTATLTSFMSRTSKLTKKSTVLTGISDGVGTGFRSFRKEVRRVLDKQWFQNVCYVVIFASFLTMAIDHYPAPENWEDGVLITEYIFTTLFGLEAALKIFGEGFTMYFASNWNRFDFFVVFISVLSLSLRQVLHTRLDALFRTLRILRLARIFRGKSSLSELVHKFGMAALNLGGVLSIIFVFFYMFGVMGMNLFGRVHWDPYAGTSGISHMSNFSNIGTTLFMLFRITFGGDWWFVWWDTRPSSAKCDPHLGDCGPPDPVPQLFFVIFIGFANFVLKNLLVAVLVDQFSSASDLRAMTKPHARAFVDAWVRFDPELTMKVSGFDVLPIIRSMHRRAPIGFQRVSRKRRVGLELRMLFYLRIRDPHARNVSFETVVDMLCHMAYEAPPPEDRPFQMEAADEDLEDDDARFSAILIVINQVALRILARRRQRKREEAEALRNAETGSKVANASIAVPSTLRSDAPQRRVRSRTFAEALTFGDPDLEFDEESDDDLLPPMPPVPRRVAVSSDHLRELRQHAEENSHHGHVAADPLGFDDSDDSDGFGESGDVEMRSIGGGTSRNPSFTRQRSSSMSSRQHSGTSQDAQLPMFDSDDDTDDSEDSVTPFFKQVQREVKSTAKGAKSRIGRTLIGRGMSMVAKKVVGVADTIGTGVSDAIEGAIVGVEGAIDRVTDGVEGAMDRVKGTRKDADADELEEQLYDASLVHDVTVGDFVAVDVMPKQPSPPPPAAAGAPQPAAAGEPSSERSAAMDDDASLYGDSSARFTSSASFGSPRSRKSTRPAPPSFLGSSPPRRSRQAVQARFDTPPPEDDPAGGHGDTLGDILMLRRHV